MRSGVLLIDKPAGISSAGVVARVKRALGADKVGHAGTLDPDATGLLVCLVNGATRVAPFVGAGIKEYTGVLQLGVRTSTDDLAGEVLERSAVIPTPSEVCAAARAFVGTIEQVPPNVSAVKVAGRRAYERERAGEDFELRARSVQVHSFDLSPIFPASEAETTGPAVCTPRFAYRIVCGAGTYVRSLARDLGQVLGCGGAAESIRRTRSGSFDVSSGVALEAVSWDSLQDWAVALPQAARIVLPEREVRGLLEGRVATLRGLDLSSCTAGPVDAERGGGLVVYAVEQQPHCSIGLLRVDSAGVRSFEFSIPNFTVSQSSAATACEKPLASRT